VTRWLQAVEVEAEAEVVAVAAGELAAEAGELVVAGWRRRWRDQNG